MWRDEILDEYVSWTVFGYYACQLFGCLEPLQRSGPTGVWIAMLLSNALTVLYGHIVYKTKDWSTLHYAKGEQS